MTWRRATLLAGLLVIALSAAVAPVMYWRYFRQGPAPAFTDDIEHFKYGSIGAEVDGLPYPIWRALPLVCPDMLPGGYASLGFISEPGRELPVGVSVRQYGLPRLGFNCATCHTAVAEGTGELLLGAPAERLNLWAYTQFIVGCGGSEQFTPARVMQAMSNAGVELDVLDRLVYRVAVLPKAHGLFKQRAAGFSWMGRRPPHGPGRTDALNPWRERHGLNPALDGAVATVDFPSVWNQRIRERMWLHWDANNNSLAERNLSAALAGGASESSLDHGSIERVNEWLKSLPAPPFPFAVDTSLAAQGQLVYQRNGCGSCHDVDGPQVGAATPLQEIGTDPERLTTLSAELLARMLGVGTGYPWRFTHYRRSNGYANSPLDGVWARAPYLHNGSIPTLWDLLLPEGDRPRSFGRGCGQFDPVKVGYSCSGPFMFETGERGNANSGHLYGTYLPDADRRALIEYLKSL